MTRFRVALDGEGRRWWAEVSYECSQGLRRDDGVRPYEADGSWWMQTRVFRGRTAVRARDKALRWVDRRLAEEDRRHRAAERLAAIRDAGQVIEP